MKPTPPQGNGLADTISKAKVLEKLYKTFCQVFKTQNPTYYLFKESYFNIWASKDLTLPNNPIVCDSYTFITLPTANSLQGGHPLLVPLHLIGLIEDNLEATYTKNKAGLISLSFIYKLSRHNFDGFSSLYEAKTYFSNFKKLELIKYYTSLKTDYESNLLEPYIASEFKHTNTPVGANHTRSCGKSSWQYSAWKNLIASLKTNGYVSLGEVSSNPKADKLVQSALLDFNYFEPLIGYVRSLTLIEDTVLTYNFFGDCFITRDTLFYLPKRLIQNHREWINSVVFKPQKTSKGFCFICRNSKGKLTRSPVFETEEAATLAYTKFKFGTLLDLYTQYKEQLPPSFCARFEKEIVNAYNGSF